MPLVTPISGYVLAGGHSSRMGQDKALISLAGKPLIRHAVTKLRRICADVHTLSGDRALAAFAPIVPDIHPHCGPISGIEAALANTTHDWNLFLPVDLPLLPTALLAQWILNLSTSHSPPPPGIRILTSGRPQPGLCLIHRDVLSLVARAILREEFALISVFEEIGREQSAGLLCQPVEHFASQAQNLPASAAWPLTAAQVAARSLWFLNINTPQDLAIAHANLDVLDT